MDSTFCVFTAVLMACADYNNCQSDFRKEQNADRERRASTRRFAGKCVLRAEPETGAPKRRAYKYYFIRECLTLNAG